MGGAVAARSARMLLGAFRVFASMARVVGRLAGV
jgi:hypothetical protein